MEGDAAAAVAAGDGGGGGGDRVEQTSAEVGPGAGRGGDGGGKPSSIPSGSSGKEMGAKPKIYPKKGSDKRQARSGPPSRRGSASEGTSKERTTARRLSERTAAPSQEEDRVAKAAKAATEKVAAARLKQAPAPSQQKPQRQQQQKQTTVADFYKKKATGTEAEKAPIEAPTPGEGAAATAAASTYAAAAATGSIAATASRTGGSGSAEARALTGAVASLSPEELAAINNFLAKQKQAAAAAGTTSTPSCTAAASGATAATAKSVQEKDSRETVDALLAAAAQHHRRSGVPDASRVSDDGFRVVGRGGRTYAAGEKVPERHQRAETPFKNPAAEEQRRSRLAYRPRQELAPSSQQRDWASKGLCVGCGGYHSVFDPSCKARFSKEQAKAILNAIRYGNGGNRKPRPQQQGSGLQARSAPLILPQGPGTGTKRPREAGSGTTPEAKRGTNSASARLQQTQQQQRQQQDPGLTLCVREKDNAPLTPDRNASLQASINEKLFQEFYMNNRMPPKINRWDRSNLVLKITMRDSAGLTWMRRALETVYQVQTTDEYKRSRGKVFIAFLQDRFNPGITGLSRATLAKIVEIEATAMGVRSLLELKLAAKVPSGLALHLIMDEEAEKVFAARDHKLDILSAGGVQFRSERELREEARANRIRRLRPLPATAGQLVQEQREQQLAMNSLGSLTVASQGTSENPLTVEDSPPAGEAGAKASAGSLRWAEEVEKEVEEKEGEGEKEGEKEKEMEGEKEGKTSSPTTSQDAAAPSREEGDGNLEDMELGKEEVEELNASSQDMMEAYLAQTQGQEPMLQDE